MNMPCGKAVHTYWIEATKVVIAQYPRLQLGLIS